MAIRGERRRANRDGRRARAAATGKTGREQEPVGASDRRPDSCRFQHDGRRVLLDDNKSPTDAFLWANGLTHRSPDTQFNHVYAASLYVDAYTALPNICMTPAFIAKLTDTSDEVRRLLRYRCNQLYEWVPKGQTPPERPPEYEVLEWAALLPAVENVRAAIEAAMASKTMDRTVMATREIG
jgi:hypothetical protein